MGPAVSLGLGRFAYALLLPPMRADLGWNFAQAGALNTANAAGYLLGALVAAPVGRRIGDKRVFAISLVLTAFAVGASGLTADYIALSALRVAAGFTGALAFVCGAGLISAAAMGGSKHRGPTLLGLHFAGAGMGITASALAVPPLLGTVGWRGGWLVLGALALTATAFSCFSLRRAPGTSYPPRTMRVRTGRHASWRARSWPTGSSRWLRRLCNLPHRLLAERRGILLAGTSHASYPYSGRLRLPPHSLGASVLKGLGWLGVECNVHRTPIAAVRLVPMSARAYSPKLLHDNHLTTPTRANAAQGR